jgi:hypothetical protein
MDKWLESYQNTYSHLHAPSQIQESIAKIGSPAHFSNRYFRRISGLAVAIVLLLALLGCGVVAVVYGAEIQSLFGRRWQQLTGQSMDESQISLLNHLSQEICISQTTKGVTVTLDSATIGDDIFYLLVRVDDTKRTASRTCSFREFSLDISSDSPGNVAEVGGCGWSTQGVNSEGKPLLLVEQGYLWNGDKDDASPLEITLTLTDLYQGDKVLVEGTWTFQATLDRTQIPQPIQLADTWATVSDVISGEQSTGYFSNIEVSSTGIRYDETFEDEDFPYFVPVLVLDSGVEIPGGNGFGSRSEVENTFHCIEQWSVPVDLDQAAHVRFGDTDIPIP